MKKILSMLLVVKLLFSMVACGNKTTTEDKKMASETKSGSQAASNKESTGAADKITLKIANYAILEKGYTIRGLYYDRIHKAKVPSLVSLIVYVSLWIVQTILFTYSIKGFLLNQPILKVCIYIWKDKDIL